MQSLIPLFGSASLHVSAQRGSEQAQLRRFPVSSLCSDAVVPLSYPGCPDDPNGLCAYDTVLAGLIQRNSEIDYEYACHGNCEKMTAWGPPRRFVTPSGAGS